MNNTTFLTLFTIVFILLGVYNVYSGLKRIRVARARGISITWYKQINLLTGFEYILLALVFLLSYYRSSKALPTALINVLAPLYIILLLSAAIIAGLVIRQSIINSRAIRAQSRSSSSTVQSNGTSAMAKQTRDDGDPQQRATNLERRRQRRRNAAAARRRRAGKA